MKNLSELSINDMVKVALRPKLPRGVVCFSVHPARPGNSNDERDADKWRSTIREHLEEYLTPMHDEATTFLIPSKVKDEQLLESRQMATTDKPRNVRVTFQIYIAQDINALKLLE